MGKTSCSRKLLLVTNTFTTIVGIGGLALSIIALVSDLLPVFELLPQVVVLGIIGVSGFIFLVSLLGILGLCIRSSCFMYCYIIFTTLSFAVTAVVTPLLLLTANEIETLDTLDSAIIEAQTELEKEFLKQAFENPDGWEDTQNSLECCGLTMGSAYDASVGAGSLNVLLSGETCDEGRETINNILGASNVTRVSAIEDAANDETIGVGTSFFCLNKVGDLLEELTIPIGVGVGFLALIQLLNVRAAFVVLYRIGYSRGGFVNDDGYDYDDEKLNKKAKKKKEKASSSNESSANGAYALSTPNYNAGGSKGLGGGGSGFGSGFGGGFGNRAGGWGDDDDDVPKPNAGGFSRAMNRVSKRVFDNDFFRPPAAPVGAGPKPMDEVRQFGNRVSKRFNMGGPPSGGGGGFGNRVSKKFGFGSSAGFVGSPSLDAVEQGGGYGSASASRTPAPNTYGSSGGFMNRLSRGFRPPRPPVPSFGGGGASGEDRFGNNNNSSGIGFGGGANSRSGVGFGGGANNSSGTGFGRSGGGGGGGGFMNRLSRGFKPSFGLGPPPGLGSKGSGFGRGDDSPFGGPSPSGGSSFGGFGGAPRGPPAFGGGGRAKAAPPLGGPGGRGAPNTSRKPPGGSSMFGFGKKKAGGAPKRAGGGGGGRGGLLSQIEGGTRLKATRTNDRSGPEHQGRVVR